MAHFRELPDDEGGIICMRLKLSFSFHSECTTGPLPGAFVAELPEA